MKKILITGASGLLGAAALSVLRSKYEVHGAYLSHPIRMQGANTFGLDLTDRSVTLAALDKIRPDVVLHTAALVNIDQCEKDPALAEKVNVTSVETLAKWCAQSGALLAQVSTDAFFDGEGRLFKEDDAPAPASVYAKTKLSAELAVRELCAGHLILRTNIYGWNYQPKQSLAEWMLGKLERKERVPAVYDVIYTPILTQTFAHAFDGLVSGAFTGTFHVASGRAISKHEFCHLLCAEFGLDASLIDRVSVKDLKLAAGRSNNMALDVSKLRKALPNLRLNVENDLSELRSSRGKIFAEA